MEKVSISSSNTDNKIRKTLGFVFLSHIVTIGVLYYGAMNFIIN